MYSVNIEVTFLDSYKFYTLKTLEQFVFIRY